MTDAVKRTDGFAGQGDAFYEALIRAHRGLGEEDSAALNSRLVLILANQIGSLPVLTEALGLARASLAAAPSLAEAQRAGAPEPGAQD
ncbi:MAG: hypothetical protein JWR08_1837 [Enterovirga sp.]|nr:hypothetical protein [Enterovirga sp.]